MTRPSSRISSIVRPWSIPRILRATRCPPARVSLRHMRIALTASLVAPIIEGEANGPHSVILDLARGLAARGHETRVYAARGSTAPGVTLRQIDVDPIVAQASISGEGAAAPAAATAALE